MIKRAIVLLYLFLAGMACREKYVARTAYPHTGYFVVEGHIDAGGGLTRIRLSRTTPLDSSILRPETGAVVSVESEAGESFPLDPDGNGIYSAPVPVNTALQYRLHFLTGGSGYASEFVPARITPAIDRVQWTEQADGVQIFVSSHDPANQTTYYKWGIAETWKYEARYQSTLIWQNNSLTSRPDSSGIYRCWKTDTPATILLASTAKLSADVVSLQPVNFISYGESFNKLYERYSVLVTESALTKPEYEWYEKLKKNTESLGSVFDAQPSEISGNIHSLTEDGESVIGFVGCRTETTSRIFIDRTELRVGYLSSGYESCRQDSVFKLLPAELAPIFGPDGYETPVNFIYIRGRLAGVAGSSFDCTDCRNKGGVLKRPAFWED